MKPLFVKYVLPFFQWYGLMILLAILVDYALHKLDMIYIGRRLGIIGTTVILFSFIYSLRKRKIIQSGSPKKLLALHEYLAWSGSVMLLVHAGIHFNALIPWLAIFMLLIVVASGLIGKFLLKKANESLKERKQSLIIEGLNPDQIEKKLHFDSLTVDTMKKWRQVHMPIAMVLAALSLLHIISILIFTK